MVPRRAPRGLLPFLFQLLGMHVFLGLRLHVWLDISFEDQHSTPWGFPGDASGKKIPPTMQEMQEMQVPSLGWADPLEEGVTTHSSIFAWRIPGAREPGGYFHRVRHDCSDGTYKRAWWDVSGNILLWFL